MFSHVAVESFSVCIFVAKPRKELIRIIARSPDVACGDGWDEKVVPQPGTGNCYQMANNEMEAKIYGGQMGWCKRESWPHARFVNIWYISNVCIFATIRVSYQAATYILFAFFISYFVFYPVIFSHLTVFQLYIKNMCVLVCRARIPHSQMLLVVGASNSSALSSCPFYKYYTMVDMAWHCICIITYYRETIQMMRCDVAVCDARLPPIMVHSQWTHTPTSHFSNPNRRIFFLFLF